MTVAIYQNTCTGALSWSCPACPPPPPACGAPYTSTTSAVYSVCCGTAGNYTMTTTYDSCGALVSSVLNCPACPSPYVPPYVPPPYVRPPDPYYGVGVPPCIQGDTLVLASQTMVLTTDGNNKFEWRKARDIKVGDQVVSLHFEEIDPTQTEYDMFTWTSNKLTYDNMTIDTVVDKVASVHERIGYINDLVDAQFTEYHPFLIMRDGVHEFYTLASIMHGDTVFMYDEKLDKVTPTEVKKITWVETGADAYNFTLDNYHLIVAAGFITHNK